MIIQLEHTTLILPTISSKLNVELHNYRKESFPLMLADARERAKNNPDSDYETKRLAYWREHLHRLNKNNNNGTTTVRKAAAHIGRVPEVNQCEG